MPNCSDFFCKISSFPVQKSSYCSLLLIYTWLHMKVQTISKLMYISKIGSGSIWILTTWSFETWNFAKSIHIMTISWINTSKYYDFSYFLTSISPFLSFFNVSLLILGTKISITLTLVGLFPKTKKPFSSVDCPPSYKACPDQAWCSEFTIHFSWL